MKSRGINKGPHWRALTGGCRYTPGARRQRADRWDLNRSHDRQFGQSCRIVILWSAMGADDSLPDDVTTLKAMLRAERAARLAAEAKAQARILLIEKLKLTIKKLWHEQFGQSSERGALLDQLELQLADPQPILRWRPSSGASRRAGRCRSIRRGSALTRRRSEDQAHARPA